MRLLILLIPLLLGCTSAEKKSEHQKADVPDFEIAVFKSPFGGYGYDILFKKTLKIHQPNIPAISTNRGFQSQESARKIASLVVVKLRNNEIPPTVSIEEIAKILGDEILR